MSAQNDSDGQAAVAPDAWPRFLGPDFDGAVTKPNAAVDWSQQPRLVWSIDVGEGYGIGSVAEGRYLHFDAIANPSGYGSLERLRSFDLQTGELQWSQTQPIVYRDLFGYEEGPRSSPTIDGERIFTLGVTGKLACRELQSGQQKWTVDTSERYGVVQNFFGVGSSPLVHGDKVMVMVGGSPKEDQDVPPLRLDRVTSNGSALVAFDKTTGEERWACGEDLASYSSPRLATLGDRTVVLLFARGGLLAIDPDEGKVLWRFDHRASMLESVNAMMPVVDGNRIFISECYEVGSTLLDADEASAQVVWQDPPRDRRRQAMRCHWATPILIDGYLYGCSGRNSPDSDFRCIEFATGKVQWTDPRRIRSSVTRLGDHLIVLEERGELQVVRPTPGQLEVVSKWDLGESTEQRPAIRYPCWAAPIVVGNKLLLRGTERVLALELATH